MVRGRDRLAEKQATLGRPSYQRILLVIIIIAVIVRLISAFYQGNQVEAWPGIADQLSYDMLAQRVAAGHGFSFAEGHWPATPAGEPTAHWSYIYTLYLAAIYSIFGYAPLVARIIQAILAGILHVWLAARLGKRLFSPTAGLLAAALSAGYIYFVYYAAGLLTESFYFVGILWTFDSATRIVARQLDGVKARHWLELGVALAMTVLLRQVFLLFVPILFVWFWFSLTRLTSFRLKRGPWNGWSEFLPLTMVKGLGLTTLVIILFIAPWTIRNYLAFDTFVPLNTNAGFAFFWGNHPNHGTRFVPLLGGDEYRGLIPPELFALNEAELDRALLNEALGFIKEDPRRLLLLSVDRTREYFKFWPTSDSAPISNVSRVGSFGILLPFMIYGLWYMLASRPADKADRKMAGRWLILLFAITYSAIHLASWTLIRYRLPVDIVLLIPAAAGLSQLIGRSPLGHWVQGLKTETV